MRDCTCVGSCRGAEGLGVGWNCVVDNGSVEDARIGAPSAPIERFQPVPVPRGDGRHDIGDDVRAAIVERLTSDWSRDPDLTPEKVRQLAMWAGASTRALLHEIGTLNDLAVETTVPWREGPPICTNCGESAKPHPTYADFVGPFCEGCWDRLREYFTSGVICPVCKHEHDREEDDCREAQDNTPSLGPFKE